jgi:hypothetical protein
MEAILVQIFSKIFQPDVQKGLAFEKELNFWTPFFDNPDSNFFWNPPILLLNFAFLSKEDLELEVEL